MRIPLKHMHYFARRQESYVRCDSMQGSSILCWNLIILISYNAWFSVQIGSFCNYCIYFVWNKQYASCFLSFFQLLCTSILEHSLCSISNKHFFKMSLKLLRQLFLLLWFFLFSLFRAGNLVGQNPATELAGEVTSSSGPVQLADLQRILSSITPQGIFSCDFSFMESLCSQSALVTCMSWLTYSFAIWFVLWMLQERIQMVVMLLVSDN